MGNGAMLTVGADVMLTGPVTSICVATNWSPSDGVGRTQ